jgi:hypothetical protein
LKIELDITPLSLDNVVIQALLEDIATLERVKTNNPSSFDDDSKKDLKALKRAVNYYLPRSEWIEQD